MTVGCGEGKPDSPIMIVGEAWGADEEERGRPFIGKSGQELSTMLHEAGIMRSECFVTNVVNARPPRNDLSEWMPETKKAITHDMVLLRGRYVKPILREGYEQLLKEIELVKPKIIIALGNTAMFALSGRSGIVKWRGSLLEHMGIRVVPTYHPAAVLRMWEWRVLAVHDLARAARELAHPTPKPVWVFRTRPTLFEVLHTLQRLSNRALLFDADVWLDFDIETTGGHIKCFAISWSPLDALCVPLMRWTGKMWEGSYWPPEEEALILWHVYKLFTAKGVKLRGQNLLYDFQYVYRHWHFIPNVGQDTMLTHHVLWAGMRKSLAYQASMYCEYYEYWKDMVKHNEEKEGA